MTMSSTEWMRPRSAGVSEIHDGRIRLGALADVTFAGRSLISHVRQFEILQMPEQPMALRVPDVAHMGVNEQCE